MTPSTADIFAGNARVIAGLAEDAPGPAFGAAKLGVVAMLSVLAAQEAEHGFAVRVMENADIFRVIDEAAQGDGMTITALDAVNAELRRKLIAYHQAVEHDPVRDAEVLPLYRRMAAGRVLTLPVM